MNLLISMPYYGSPETVRSAVVTLLQSKSEFELLVLNDGDNSSRRVLDSIADPRLIIYDLPKNRGRYFADAVALEANPYEYFMPTDSDDLSEPGRVGALLAQGADATFHYQTVQMLTPGSHGRVIRRETYPLLKQPLRQSMRHICHWSGVYKTEALKQVGGIHPDFRVGYDTLLVNLLKMNEANIVLLPQYLYTRKIREGSLTKSPETGYGSPHRLEAIKKLIKLYDSCYKNPRSIQRIVTNSIDPKTRQAVKAEADKLRKFMAW